MLKIPPMLAVGQVIKKAVWREMPVAKVRLQNMTLDKNLLMYFPNKTDKWTIDTSDDSSIGDIVVIKNLDERFGKDIIAKVDNILYKMGHIVDPVTGRPCRGTEYIDEAERKIEQSKRTAKAIMVRRYVEVESSETD